MWKRKALCSNGVPCRSRMRKRIRPCVGLVHLVLAPGEADPGGVDDREVVGHRGVEPDEAVVEDVDDLLYHFTHDRHGIEASPRLCGRLLGLVLPVLAARFLPCRAAARGVPRSLRGAPAVGRAELDRVSAPGRGPVRALGRQVPAGFLFAVKAPPLALRSPGTFVVSGCAGSATGSVVRVVVEAPRDDGLLALLLGSTGLRSRSTCATRPGRASMSDRRCASTTGTRGHPSAISASASRPTPRRGPALAERMNPLIQPESTCSHTSSTRTRLTLRNTQKRCSRA